MVLVENISSWNLFQSIWIKLSGTEPYPWIHCQLHIFIQSYTVCNSQALPWTPCFSEQCQKWHGKRRKEGTDGFPSTAVLVKSPVAFLLPSLKKQQCQIRKGWPVEKKEVELKFLPFRYAIIIINNNNWIFIPPFPQSGQSMPHMQSRLACVL